MYLTEKICMVGTKLALIGWGSVLGLLCCLLLSGGADAQSEASRAPRRGVPSPAAPGNTATAPAAKAPQPLSLDAKISLDQNGLSVDVQDQDFSVVVERIAELAHIELRHPEGMPNRRVSIRFASLPVAQGLKRIFRAAEVPGYVMRMAKQGDSVRVQRIVFLPEEGTSGPGAGRGAQRAPQVAAAQPPQPPRPAPVPPQPPGMVPQPPTATPPEAARADEGRTSGNVFDEIKSNAAARRLLSQMMHPNEQVRERAFEGLVRLVREDDKQRALMELLEPLMEDLGSEDKATQDEAREEIRKLLSR
jgi:hypothetical protein